MFRIQQKRLAAVLVGSVALMGFSLLAHRALAKSPPGSKESGTSKADKSPLSPKDFTKIHTLIKPQEGESKYLDEIDWVPTLWEARQKAAAEGKPLFILEAGGSPLGLC
jgi:hypothetical protein